MLNITRHYHRLCVSLFFAGLLVSPMEVAMARNLGVEGAVYTIVEPDMLAGIQQKLQRMQHTGELARQNKAILKRTIQHVLRPHPVSGGSDLSAGDKPKSHYFDPSIVLNEDIKNAQGDLLAKRGTRINPLEHINFHQRLVFINGDNSTQIDWARRQLENSQQPIMIILVNGNIKAAAAALQHRLYFDQHGKLCQRFGINHTPTLVYQPVGGAKRMKKLVVQEVQID